MTIAPAALAPATAGRATSQTITVSGGTKPYATLSISGFFSAGTTGLTAANLTTNAVAGTVTLSGTPSAAGTASFTVDVTDTGGATLNKTYKLKVNPGIGHLRGRRSCTRHRDGDDHPDHHGVERHQALHQPHGLGLPRRHHRVDRGQPHHRRCGGDGDTEGHADGSRDGELQGQCHRYRRGATLNKTYKLTVRKAATRVKLSVPSHRIHPGELLLLRIIVSPVGTTAVAQVGVGSEAAPDSTVAATSPTGLVVVKEGTKQLGVMTLSAGKVRRFSEPGP